MTDTLVIISLVLQALIIVILIFLLVRKKQDLREISLDDFKKQLSKEFNEEVFNLASKLNNEKVEERLSKGFEATNETFGKIKESMAVMEQAQQKIEGLSNEMISLQDILSNNQQRGAFGEYQ